MKFNNLIAVLAITTLSLPANAQDGMLRRVVAQNDTVQADTAIINNNTNTTVQAVQQAPAPSVQPATVVEAAPVMESKAEQLRKARQGAEVATEQKIVEKLEESRLKEEQDRADRLFGNKLDASQTKAIEDASANMNSGKVAPTPVPTQVTIETVEFIQPAVSPVAPPEVKSITAEKEVIPPAIAAPVAPAAVSKMEVEEAEEEAQPQGSKFYVSGSLGGMEYDASNVKSNGAGGFAIGVLTNERTAIEANFLYSSHYIDTFWNPGIYRELDQYNIGINAKYYILSTRIKPFLGAGASYIMRNYSQRVVTTNGFGQTQTVAGPSEDDTESVNLDLMAGADFQVNEMFMIGAGLSYSTNIMNRNEFDFNQYAVLPENTKALEEIDFWTFKVTGSLTF